jgi:hypothetical protein
MYGAISEEPTHIFVKTLPDGSLVLHDKVTE